eukprot:11203818-Lingulodinium_polyedra.AAC.1
MATERDGPLSSGCSGAPRNASGRRRGRRCLPRAAIAAGGCRRCRSPRAAAVPPSQARANVEMEGVGV